MNTRAAIIGGTGFESALQSHFGEPISVESLATEYGRAVISIFGSSGFQVAFLARHGAAHSVAPHNINHRANIAGLKAFGITSILSTSAVGSLTASIAAGDVVIPNDFIDLRGGAPTTFYDGEIVVHTDFSEPFSVPLRAALLACAESQAAEFGLSASIIHPGGVYLCLNGPRYETAAEIRCFAALGAQIVGMTVAPEAILAREAGLRYASLSVATNYGAGLQPTTLAHAEVEQMMAQRRPFLTKVIIESARAIVHAELSNNDPPGRTTST